MQPSEEESKANALVLPSLCSVLPIRISVEDNSAGGGSQDMNATYKILCSKVVIDGMKLPIPL